MANNICSSFLRRCLPGPTKPLCRPTPAAKGVHHLINKAASRHFHHHQPGAQKYFEFDCKAAPVRTSCQRSVHQKCLLNLNLSVATSNYCASKSLFWKNLHTSISKLKFDAETDNKERLCKDKDDDVNLVIDNVSPEVNKFQTGVEVTQVVPAAEKPLSVDVISSESEGDLDILVEKEKPGPVEEYVEPPLPPESYTLAAYIEHSEVLQKLVDLGVDLSKVERRPGVGEHILKMNFEPDITEKISFLHFVGVESDKLGKFLTKNPSILLEDQENLEKRVQYLMDKKFDQTAIAQIVNRAPYFLSFSVS